MGGTSAAHFLFLETSQLICQAGPETLAGVRGADFRLLSAVAMETHQKTQRCADPGGTAPFCPDTPAPSHHCRFDGPISGAARQHLHPLLICMFTEANVHADRLGSPCAATLARVLIRIFRGRVCSGPGVGGAALYFG